tara:strand:+ start:500 stop:712 length:213 start_codon:yes stop_codon:yes gene_type:complete
MSNKEINYIELGLFISGILGAITMMIRQLQLSICSEIKCCCIECKRDTSKITNKEITETQMDRQNTLDNI